LTTDNLRRAGGLEGEPDPHEAFLAALARRANQAIEPIDGLPIVPLEFPDQGDFNWCWESASRAFNQATFDYLSARVLPGTTPGTVRLSPAGGFPLAYSQLLASLAFELSPSDQAALDQAIAGAAREAEAVVRAYEGLFGTISPEAMLEAQEDVPSVRSPLDYVVAYILGAVWSGATPPLSWGSLREARDLEELVPGMPPAASLVPRAASAFLRALGPALDFADALHRGSWTLARLKANTTQPASRNGGMPTVDPHTRRILPARVGYAVQRGVAAILNDLDDTERTFEVGLSIVPGTRSRFEVRVDEGAPFEVDEILSFAEPLADAFGLGALPGTGPIARMTLAFAGFALIPIEPSAWRQGDDWGWYSGDPIAEAWHHWTLGVRPTGFHFLSDPRPFLGDDGRELGRITGLLISNHPTLTLDFEQADSRAFQETWKEGACGNLALFGTLPLGRHPLGSHTCAFRPGASNDAFSLIVSPSPQALSVPSLQQTAYVVGGTFDYPASGNPASAQRHLRLVK